MQSEEAGGPARGRARGPWSCCVRVSDNLAESACPGGFCAVERAWSRRARSWNKRKPSGLADNAWSCPCRRLAGYCWFRTVPQARGVIAWSGPCRRLAGCFLAGGFSGSLIAFLDCGMEWSGGDEMEPKAQRWRNEPEQNAMSRNKRDESAAARPEPCRNMSQTCEARRRLLSLSASARSAELKCPPLTLLGGTRVFAWPTYGLHMNRTQPLTRSDRTATRERRGQRKGTKLKPKSWPVPAPRLTEPGGHEALPPSARGAVAKNATPGRLTPSIARSCV